MQTVQDVIDSDFKWRMGSSDTAASFVRKQEGSFRYIAHLCAITQTDAWKVPIDLFMDEKGTLPIVRNTLNKIFFDWKSRQEEETENPTVPTLSADLFPQIERFEKQSRAAISRSIERLSDEIRNKQVELSGAIERVDNRTRELNELEMRSRGLKELEKSNLHTKNELEKLLRDPFWRIAERGPEEAINFTTAPITLSYFNSEHDVQCVVPLGSFSVSLSHSGAGIRVVVGGCKDNVWVSQYLHPHVGSDGHVCFGNVKHKAIAFGAKAAIYEYMQLVKAVLTSYNTDNPYVELHSFDRTNEDFSGSDQPDSDDDSEEEGRSARRLSYESFYRLIESTQVPIAGWSYNPIPNDRTYSVVFDTLNADLRAVESALIESADEPTRGQIESPQDEVNVIHDEELPF